LFVCLIIVRIRKGWLILTVQLEQSLMIDEVFPRNQENSPGSIDHDSDRWQPRTQDYAVNQGP